VVLRSFATDLEVLCAQTDEARAFDRADAHAGRCDAADVQRAGAAPGDPRLEDDPRRAAAGVAVEEYFSPEGVGARTAAHDEGRIRRGRVVYEADEVASEADDPA
jgi:hypothetical protein